MKRCPKCGTILDDSKKSCYMCGTVLKNNNSLNFGDSFDKQIGATITNNQGNVFGNNKSGNMANPIGNMNNNTFYSQNGNATNYYQNHLNSSRPPQFDNRTALEKSFSADNRFQNNNMPQNQNSANFSVSWSSKNPTNNKNNSRKVNNTKKLIQKSPKIKENKPIPSNNNINWGNNLVEKEPKGKFHLSLSFVFNTVCFILFLGAMVLVYFKYIRKDENKNAELGGLVYTIDKNFNLKTDDNFSRYYTSGDDCAVRISYGNTNDVDTFIDEYYNQVKEEYSEEDGFMTKMEELKINGNVWYEIEVIDFQDNPAASSGFSATAKYRFISMIYEGTFYDIRYVNLKNDSTCSAMYDSFITTLALKENK